MEMQRRGLEALPRDLRAFSEWQLIERGRAGATKGVANFTGGGGGARRNAKCRKSLRQSRNSAFACASDVALIGFDPRAEFLPKPTR